MKRVVAKIGSTLARIVSNKNLRKVIMKVGLVLGGIIFIVSIVLLAKGYSTPVETNREVTLANYSHKGGFDCRIYTKPGLLSTESPQENIAFFTKIVDSTNILFSYSFLPDKTLGEIEEKVKVDAILEDRDGNWQKRIPLVPKQIKEGKFVLSFPLDTDQLLEIGQTIDQELGGSLFYGSSSYFLRIEAEVEIEGETDYGTIEDVFVSKLGGKLSSSSLEWEEGLEPQFERGQVGQLGYWHRGEFGYEVKLKPNSIYGPITLEKGVDSQLKPVELEPGMPPFAQIVEGIDVDFNYQFDCDVEIQKLSGTFTRVHFNVII